MDWRTLIVVVGLGAASCGTDSATLVVQVRTDLNPEMEFDRVEVVATPTDGVPVSRTTMVAEVLDWEAGGRVFESGLALGEVSLSVRALDSGGRPVVARPVRVELGSGVRVVTVLLTRDCVGVTCDADMPSAAACLGGRCVSERCIEEELDECPMPECAGTADCAPSIAECAVNDCSIAGRCVERANPGVCIAPEECTEDFECIDQTPRVCTELEEQVSVTLGATADNPLAIAATDSAVLVAGLDVRLAAIVVGQADDGAVLDGDPIATAATIGRPVLVSTGGGARIGYTADDASIALQELDASGAVMALPALFSVGALGSGYSLGWSGSRVGLAWSDRTAGNDDLHFVTQIDGSFAGGSQLTMGPGNSSDPVVIWTGSEFVVLFRDDRGGEFDVFAWRVAEDGMPLVEYPLVDAGVVSVVDMAVDFDGTNLGIVYATEDGAIYFQAFAPTLLPILAPVEIAGGHGYTGGLGIAWGGTEYGCTWQDGTELVFARLAGSGTVLSSARALTVASELASSPVLTAAADGSGRWFAAYAAAPMASCCTIYVTHICPL